MNSPNRQFVPDFSHFLDAMVNKRPHRLPLYEHIISPHIMERVLNAEFAECVHGNAADLAHFFGQYCSFFNNMTYDVVSYEVCITDIWPGHGAICGGRPGPIQNEDDFDLYPWEELPDRYWQHAAEKFEALSRSLPPGMKAVGGVGNGVFEISEDLVGLEYLPFLQADDPALYEKLFAKIGHLMVKIWKTFLDRYKESFVACRFGDDLGFKSSLLTNPDTIRNHILPQYARVIALIHEKNRPFLWHSCGNILEIMEDAIALGIDAKHSNEDAIAPFSEWIFKYGSRIGLLGGFDMDFLCQQTPEEIYERVVELGAHYRAEANGYALGSGNSITDFMPVENYLAMIEAAQEIRRREANG